MGAGIELTLTEDIFGAAKLFKRAVTKVQMVVYPVLGRTTFPFGHTVTFGTQRSTWKSMKSFAYSARITRIYLNSSQYKNKDQEFECY